MSLAQTAPTTLPATSADFAAALRNASPGDVVRTTFADATSLPTTLPVVVAPSADAALLAFSDRPEYFRAGDGIASQDDVSPGRVRLYTYHVPVLADGKPRRVLTVIENLGDRQATLTFAARSEPDASGDYNAVAKQAMLELLTGHRGGEIFPIPPHGKRTTDFSSRIEKADLLVHGLFDFTTDQPLRLTVAQVTASDSVDDDVAKLATLPKLPMLPYGKATDKSGRGVFPYADVDVMLNAPYDTASGPRQLSIANGKADPWIVGRDGLTGDATTDKGNYGVLYHASLKWRSADGRGVALLMTGSHYDPKQCGYVSAVVKVNDGRRPGGVVELPRGAVRFHGVPEACVIQTYDAPPNGTEGTIDVTYTPPGSCCLPTPMLLVPIEK